MHALRKAWRFAAALTHDLRAQIKGVSKIDGHDKLLERGVVVTGKRLLQITAAAPLTRGIDRVSMFQIERFIGL